jgi:hypothetical protein
VDNISALLEMKSHPKLHRKAYNPYLETRSLIIRKDYANWKKKTGNFFCKVLLKI